MSWEAKKGKTASSGFGRKTGERNLKRSNWNGSGITDGRTEGFTHSDARNIYLIGRSPHGNEQSKLGLKSTMSKLPPKPATKVERAKEMSYFMETLDLKNQIQQLELQNRQLRIEFKKARQAYLELQFKDRTRDTQDDEPEEIQEREFFAEQVVSLRHQIGDLKDELIRKNREFEGLKLVRKEISERELKNKVETLEAECEAYRTQAVKLMQKYPGYGETEAMDEEDHHEYRFSNLVLGEYDALLNELVQTLEKVETHRRKRDEERLTRNDKVEKLREENQKQMLKHREIEEEIKDLEKTKEMMNNFSKAKIEDIRRQRDHLLTEGQKLDEEIIRLNKEGDNVKKHFENQIKGMEGKLSMMDSEYNDILQKLNKKANDEQSEDLEKKEKDEQAAQNENKKAEKLRPVKFSQVEASGLDINRRLTLRRIPIDDAFELLITVNDEKDFHPKDTYFKTLNSNLHKEPFFLNKENSKLVARYLVEDNFEETVEFDIMRSQSKLTVKSIFKNLVGYVKVRELDELKKMYNEIHSAVNANRAGISSKLQDKEKRESVPVSRFIDEIRGATETVLKLNEEQKNFLIITMIERSEGSKEIKIESIFSFFSAKEFEEMYLSTGQNMGSSRKTGHKKTFTNHVRPGAKRDSVSEMSEDNKRTEGKGTSLNSSQPVNKGKQGVEVTDFGTSLAGHKSPDHQTIKEESGPKEISDDSDDLSRVSDEGPPPNFKINEVKTFNNPETKEKIYTLEQIKAAGQVKSAFGSLMFGNKKPEAADPVKKEQNSDKTDKKTTPLEFVLTKKVTYQDTNKIDQKTGAVIETMGKKFDQKEVPQENAVSTNPGNKQAIDTQNKPKEAGNQGAKSENKPSQGQTTAEPGKTVAGPPGGKTQAETGKVEQKPAGTEAVAKPPQQAKQKQPLIIDDSDDFGDEDDEIDRMLAENKGRDDEF